MSSRKTIMIPSCELVFDPDIYPRTAFDPMHVNDIVEAKKSGAHFLPIIIDRLTKKIVDGWHRTKADIKIGGPEAISEVEERDYPNEDAMWLEAMVLNKGHGKRLGRYDHVKCILLSRKRGLSDRQIADSLSITVDRVNELVLRKTAISPNDEIVAIKHTASHLAGSKLTPERMVGNERAGGLPIAMYANQLINAIENDLIDWNNIKLIERLICLREMLAQIDFEKRQAA